MSKKEQIFMKMNRIHFLYSCLARHSVKCQENK